MDDLISRQETCDSLNKYRIEKMLEGKDISLVWECIDKVLQEPSAQSDITLESAVDYLHNIGWLQEHDRIMSERKTGQWVPLGGSDWCCSACGHIICTEGSWDHPLDRGCRYCEHCGAEMKGEEDAEVH